MKKFLVLLLLVSFVFASCVTPLVVNSNVKGADVYLDGVNVGQTPLVTDIPSFAWYDPIVRIEMEGYETFEGRLDKDVRILHVVFGAIFVASLPISVPLLLNCYGPVEEQMFELSPVVEIE